jgi:hypothetical protein
MGSFSRCPTLGVLECRVNVGFYCPSSTQTYSAITTGTNGHAGTVVFDIANANTLFASGNSAFNNLGGDSGQNFDFGLPFFFGRSVFVGIEGRTHAWRRGPVLGLLIAPAIVFIRWPVKTMMRD